VRGRHRGRFLLSFGFNLREGGRVKLRLIIPDSHGAHIDWAAANAMLADAKALDPAEIVLLGDHLDCGGTFSTHQRTYTNEMTESYEEDCVQANLFLDRLQAACPNAKEIHYLEGNHEQHVERWASRNIANHRDAVAFLERNGPAHMLQLQRRGILYYRRSEFYQGLAIPGCFRLGKCFFVHGISHAKHATATHLERFGASVVHGHTHRSQSHVQRTVTSGGHGAWCPGTLAKLQPLYKHTAPSDWSHGYAVQDVLKSGVFEHTNVPIFGDRTIAGIRRAEAEEPEPDHDVRTVAPSKDVARVERAAAARRAAAERAATKVVRAQEKTEATLIAARNARKGGPTAGDCAKALRKHKGNQVQAAKSLNISRFVLRHRLGLV
jgi:predicted phosphodiesterase